MFDSRFCALLIAITMSAIALAITARERFDSETLAGNPRSSTRMPSAGWRTSQPAVRERSVTFLNFGGATPSTHIKSQVRPLGNGLCSALAWDIVDVVTFECAPRLVRRDLSETPRQIATTRSRVGARRFHPTLLQFEMPRCVVVPQDWRTTTPRGA